MNKLRNEREMMNLIIGVARTDERIRAVYMNGSRTDPRAPKDLFQDYDIVYVVTETSSFLQDKNWIKLTVPLLDKDGCLPIIPPPAITDYYVQKPTEAQFASCTNNFWWCLQNVAKGIWREELPYARQMYEQTTRKSLEEMMDWWIGTRHDFRVSTGKLPEAGAQAAP